MCVCVCVSLSLSLSLSPLCLSVSVCALSVWVCMYDDGSNILYTMRPQYVHQTGPPYIIYTADYRLWARIVSKIKKILERTSSGHGYTAVTAAHKGGWGRGTEGGKTE